MNEPETGEMMLNIAYGNIFGPLQLLKLGALC